MSIEIFELTPEHILLLRKSYVRDELSDCEYGAAEIDGKRPYGNSNIERDVAGLVGIDLTEDGEFITHADEKRCADLHKETPLALQIVLHAGSFEPGTYRRSSSYSRDWERV